MEAFRLPPRCILKTSLILAASALALLLEPTVAGAEVSQDQITALQNQIQTLQKQLDQIKAEQQKQAASSSPVSSAAAVPAAGSGAQTETAGGGVKVTVGGFVETAAIDRSKNETADVASNFNTAIPFNNVVNAHQSEFRGSARQSRITVLAQAKASDDTELSAYAESDFLGAAPTATSTESNSYNPRLRVAYAGIDQPDSGWHFLAGQNWSLLTTSKTGITPRQENIPLTIDAQYVPGFNWTRNPQVRIVKDFDDQKVWLGISAESPQASLGGIAVPGAPGVGAVNFTNLGVSPLNTSGSYSTDFAPDFIAKAAFDPGWGHYEVFGVERTFHDNVLATFKNNYTSAVSGGAAAILPVIDKKLSVQANVMAGQGIGRYGSVQLPDLAFQTDGSMKPLTGYTALAGIVGHPVPTWDTYLYGGYEGVQRDDVPGNANRFGYGDFGLDNSGCEANGGTCQAQTAHVWQIAGGFWDRIFDGSYGKMQVGVEDSVTDREAFSDSNGNAPHAYENTVMASFRFYPQ
jgi:hypothetical protein